MTNKYDSGAQMSPKGWIAWYRDPRWGQNRVLREGKHDSIFLTEQDAKDAAHDALMNHLNGNMTGEANIPPRPTSKEIRFAEANRKLFMGGGKSVVVETRAKVERRGAVA